MRICWSWNLNPSPERLWEMQNLIFYPPQMSSCVCVCVFASGRLECNSSDEVTCWSLFKHCPRTPDPLDQTCQCPRQLTRWLRLLAHITSHLSQSLPMIAMIWHYVFCDPPKPLSRHWWGPPALLFLCVWLCSQQPHLLWVNTTLGTISPPLAKLLLTLFSWGLIACQQDVALAESLTQPS